MACALVGLLFSSPARAHAQPAADISEQEAYEIGLEAFLYLYPLAVMDATRRNAAAVGAGSQGDAMNRFTHVRAGSLDESQRAARPNFDVLFSVAWLDLTNGPMIVAVPDTRGRYYVLPMLDMWSEVFASIGKRTTGTGAARFLVAPPGWQGGVPKGLERIDAPTPYVWILGRTEVDGFKDHEAVHSIQDGYAITPMSTSRSKGRRGAATNARKVEDDASSKLDVENMDAAALFAYTAELLKVNAPHIADQPIVARMRRIGIEVGKSFDLSKVDIAIRRALHRVPAAAYGVMRAQRPKLGRVVNGWEMYTDTLGVYGTNYVKRAIVAGFGLGANRPEDVVQATSLGDAQGEPLTGARKYALHFGRNEIPPVSTSWSVTLYDKYGVPVENDLKRYSIGDRSGVKYDADGSLVVYLQRESPGKESESNWLPTPGGEFTLTMRLYSPKAQVLDGRWSPPPVKIVE